MFKETPYKDVDFNNTWDGFLYKMHTIEGILKRWMLFYEEYQRRTYGFLPGWYHKMSNYTNLNKKVRTSTLPEIPDTDMLVNFKEPQYIFSYKNTDISGDVKSFNWFIDGKFAIPTHTVIYHGYQYVYFPTSKISENSVIEVERFDGTMISYPFTIAPMVKSASDYSYTLTLEKWATQPIPANSLFIVNTETGEYLTEEDIEVTIDDPILHEVKVNLRWSVFMIDPKAPITFTLKKEELVGAPLRLCCNRVR
jgi:hypothetical protein